MAIDFTSSPGNLFNVLGRLLAAVNNELGRLGTVAPSPASTWGATGTSIACLDTTVNNVVTQFVANANIKPLVNLLYSNRDSLRGSSAGWLNYLARTLAEAVVVAVVDADVHLTPATKTIQGAWAEIIAQMKTGAYYFSPPTVSASVATLVSPTTSGADGVCAASIIGPNGVSLVNVFPEVIDVICTGDSQTGGGGTLARETFSVNGDAAALNPLGFDWPAGSGASTSLSALDANSTASNLLANGDFETFTVANTPDSWTIAVGTPATDIFGEATLFYTGAKALKFTGAGGGPLTEIYQALTTLRPLTVYAGCVWLRKSAGLAAGVLALSLYDGTTTINDAASTANLKSVTLSGLTTSYAATTFFFRTPAVLPATTRFRVKATTALTSGESCYIDRLCFAAPAAVYAGGPYVPVFSGATKFIRGDKFPVTVSNDQSTSKWTMGLDRLFSNSLRQQGQQVPITGSTVISDGLIAIA